jgi:hypothetical protein
MGAREFLMDPKHASRLHKHANLTDILIQIEDFLDGLDLYVFKNWFLGEIFKGPEIRRYWVDITLLYEYEDMPDPQGGIRLIKHGASVRFEKQLKEVALPIDSADDFRENKKGKPKMAEKPVWLVHISIPRKFIEELDDDDLQLYDDDVDSENVSDARDENIDKEDAYQDGSDDDADDTVMDDDISDSDEGDDDAE